MPQLTIGPDYWRKERDDAYYNWAEAFPREFMQNSCDAAARLIEIDFLGLVGRRDLLRCIVADDGKGMDRNILDNVFFKLGASTKDVHGSTNTGGFGRARQMTHFAAEGYEIITNDIKVVGRASEYNYVESEGFRRGCQMIIDLIPKNRWNNDINLKAEFVNFLKTCQLEQRVVIDGERHTEWTYRRKLLKPLSYDERAFANLYVNKSAIDKDASEGVLLVRVNGLTMFKQSVSPKVQVILEIDPTMSREVLTSNRDGLSYGFRGVLTQFVETLNTETKSALRVEEKETRHISGTGSFVSYREDATAKLSNRGKGQRVAAAHSVLPDRVDLEIDRKATRTNDNSGFDLRELAARPNTTVTDVTDETAEEEDSLDETESDGQEETDDEPPDEAQCVWELPAAPVEEPKVNAPIVIDQAARNNLFDMFIFLDMGEYTDAEKKAVRAVVGAYNPLNWKVSHRPSQATAKNPTGVFFEGLQRAKLLLIWKTMCHHVVQEALHLFDMEKISWGVGWNFDSDDFKYHPSGDIHYLLINPVDRAGKMRYELRKQSDLDTMMAFAVHEVTHIMFSRHDEEFANNLTTLMARCLKRLPAIKRGIRDVYKVRMV